MTLQYIVTQSRRQTVLHGGPVKTKSHLPADVHPVAADRIAVMDDLRPFVYGRTASVHISNAEDTFRHKGMSRSRIGSR